MEQEVPPEESDVSSKRISIKALRRDTRNLISTLLNPEKVIPSDKGLSRDWHGLAELCGISGEKIPSLVRIEDPCAKILEIWAEQSADSTIDKLLQFLEDLDRYDVIVDIESLVEQDIEYFRRNPDAFIVEPPCIDDKDILTIDDIARKKDGLSPQTYDAFVLFADDDIDFATELVETMEKQYNLKLCVKDRDLVGGAFEYDSMIQLISNRCGRLVIVVSPAFLDSPANKFFCSFAQVQGIEQRKRKIIPCLYKPCDVLPPDLRLYFLLDYVRSGKFCNFWDKLHSSIMAPQAPPTAIGETPSQVDEIPNRVAEHASFNKSMENLKPVNHVRFSSMVNLNVDDEVVHDKLEPKISPSASYNNLAPYSGNLKKSKSIYKRLKQIIQPRGAKQVEKSDDKPKMNGLIEKEKKSFWKSRKVKVAVAN